MVSKKYQISKPERVDLARIELATVQCECTGMPLTYRPSSLCLQNIIFRVRFQ